MIARLYGLLIFVFFFGGVSLIVFGPDLVGALRESKWYRRRASRVAARTRAKVIAAAAKRICFICTEPCRREEVMDPQHGWAHEACYRTLHGVTVKGEIE